MTRGSRRTRTLLISLALGTGLAVLHPLILALTVEDMTASGATARGQTVEPFRPRWRTLEYNGTEFVVDDTRIIRPSLTAPGAIHYLWMNASASKKDGGTDDANSWAPRIATFESRRSQLDTLTGVTFGYGWPFVSAAVDSGSTSFQRLTPFNGIAIAGLGRVETDRGSVDRAIPTRIIWLGLILNTGLYAVVALTSLSLCGMALRGRRRRRRARRLGVDEHDLCRKCDHVITGLTRCPECGTDVRTDPASPSA